MALFRKIIVRPNVYSVKTSKGRSIKAVTTELLADVVKQNNAMLAAGLKIPAPFAHKDENNIVPSLLEADEETDAQTRKRKNWSSDINGGFWKKFELTPKGELAGYVEIPNDKDAEKIGSTIQETSVFLEPEFEDGLGRKWSNALRHVALVVNPVEPDQTNFELVDTSPEYSLAMAFCMSDAVGTPPKKDGDGDGKKNESKPPSSSSSPDSGSSSSSSSGNLSDTSKEDPKSDDSNVNSEDEEQQGSGNIPEIVSLLKDKLGYELPSDTTPQNFMDRLRTLLTSIKKDQEEEEEDFASEEQPKKDDNSVVKPSPVAMSQDQNKDNIVLLEKLEKKASTLVDNLVLQVKTALKGRIEALIEKGKIGKEIADKMLYPQVDALTMSLEDLNEDGSLPELEAEKLIVMAEQLSGFDSQSDFNKPRDGKALEAQDQGESTATADELENSYKIFM